MNRDPDYYQPAIPKSSLNLIIKIDYRYHFSTGTERFIVANSVSQHAV